MTAKAKARTPQRRRRTPEIGLPDRRLVLLDRERIAWEDHTGTWRGAKTDDGRLHRLAPAGFQVVAVLQPEHPYLWIGIAAPHINEPRLCYAVIKGEPVRELAAEIRRYAPEKGGKP